MEAFHDPAIVTRAEPGAKLTDLLREDAVKAVIMGNDLPKGPDWAPVIPDAAAKDRAWWELHGFMPINHMLVVGARAAREQPDAVRAAYRLLVEADAAVRPPQGEPQKTLFGRDVLDSPLAFTIETCLRQKLLPRPLTPDDVFGPATHAA